jgi:hypothetical protein
VSVRPAYSFKRSASLRQFMRSRQHRTEFDVVCSHGMPNMCGCVGDLKAYPRLIPQRCVSVACTFGERLAAERLPSLFRITDNDTTRLQSPPILTLSSSFFQACSSGGLLFQVIAYALQAHVDSHTPCSTSHMVRSSFRRAMDS